MISIGDHYRGPELDGSKIEKLLGAVMRGIIAECGHFVGGKDIAGPHVMPPAAELTFEVGSAPTVNVVFYVPGSLGDFDFTKIEVTRFSRKQKKLLVVVPVPKEEVERGGAVEFVIGALHEANRIAAETFARKRIEPPFDLEAAEAIVETVRQSLLQQGY